MNIVKDNFSIKDLENLSGIKAHTIRIWEKRYKLLNPNRTDTNIRYYSLASLQKLLNIVLLCNNGYKISKIAQLSEEEIPFLVKQIGSEGSINNESLNSFKLAMINFDQGLFAQTYNTLITTKTFREIFYDVFIPLLTELGLLWQTDTITPAHEHFITGLIKQKVIANTENLAFKDINERSKVFVLFLPENEIHEIGLLFLNHELILKGKHTIYLGPTVPMDNLKNFVKDNADITFISYFTIEPAHDKILTYLSDFENKIISHNNNELWILGRQVHDISQTELPKSIKVFYSIIELTDYL